MAIESKTWFGVEARLNTEGPDCNCNMLTNVYMMTEIQILEGQKDASSLEGTTLKKDY